MKKFLVILLFIFIPFKLFAFTVSDFEAKKAIYVKTIETKLGERLAKLPNSTIDKLNIVIDKRIKIIEKSEKLSDSSKLKKLSLLYALREVIVKISSTKIVPENNGLVIKIINDDRCKDCKLSYIDKNLKKLPFLKGAKYISYDYSDLGMKEYLKTNKIKFLPAIILSTNNINDNKNEITPYLVKLKSNEYSLQVGASFDPFIKRSENGFMILEKEKLKAIKENSYIKGNSEAKITWLEYSDVECPFCAKLYNNGTPKDLEKKYGDKLNYIYNHFPLSFHKNAKTGAEILECSGEEKGAEVFYSLLEETFSKRKSAKDFMISEAVKLGVSKTKLETCLKESTFSEKIDNQMKVGADTFGITGTPGNVLINNETGEYEIISGAYPTTKFIKVIDSLLK